MRLRKKHGGCTVAGHEWAKDGAVAEVPDELGTELLALAPDEYEHLLDDAPAEEEEPPAEEEKAEEPAPEPEASADEPAAETTPPAAGHRGQQPRNRRR